MNSASLRRTLSKALSTGLCASILLLTPGTQELFAQTVRTGPTAAPGMTVPAVPVLGGALNAAPSNLNITGTNLVLPTLSPTTLPKPVIQAKTQLTAVAAPNAAALSAPISAAKAEILLQPKARLYQPAEQNSTRAPPAQQAATAKEVLETSAESLAKDETPAGRQQTLETLFTGGKAAASDAVDASSLDSVPQASGLHALPSLGELESIAVDSARPEAERKGAVENIAQGEGAEVQDSLQRVAAANPEGGAADYEVHRAALRALAGKGVILSLRPVSKTHAAEILARLTQNKPDLAIFDYDDTLQKWNTPISPETAAALKASNDAGVRTMILTDRPDVAQKPGDTTILDSLQPMSAEQKAGLIVQSSRGTRTTVFNRDGSARLIDSNDVSWTESEKTAITDAAAVMAERYGKPSREEFTAYTYFRTLRLGLSKAETEAAAAALQDELKTRGIDVEVIGRMPKDVQKDEPYLSLSKIDKSIGVRWTRSNLAFAERMMDAVKLGLSGRWLERLAGLFRRLPSRPVAAEKTLIVGDQFFGAKVTDRNMTKGAPGALALSVGGTADPRIDNVFVLPENGAAGSLSILGALGRAVPSEMNKKAVLGLFSSRTASIASFILTGIAYPFIAVPVVGWAGFGALMALGPLAAIATGPLNGLLVDRLSARNAMTLNAVIKVGMNLVLPIMAAAGILNFWTLLAASFANGWLLSSVMTTENAYIKSLAGKKNISTVNGLVWMNYLAIQVVLGLLLGVGQIVDAWDPNIAFLISAAVHALIVAPILWFTMPNIRREAPATPEKPSVPLKSRILDFLSKNWLPALLLAGAAALYAFSAPLLAAAAPFVTMPAMAAVLLKSTLPMTAALMYWISRGSSFKSLWNGGGREVSETEKALEAKIAEAQKAGRPDEAKELGKELKKNQVRLRTTMLYLGLAALMFYPLSSFLLPLMAQTLVGAAAKGMLLGQFSGSLFFGNLISTSAQAKLPEVRIPLIGRVPGQRFIQAAVAAMGAAWVYLRVAPGSLPLAAAAALVSLGLIALSGKLTNRGWVKLFGVGFLAVLFPFLVWTMPALIPFLTVQTAMMLSLLAVGMFFGPGQVSLNSYFQQNAGQGKMGSLIGIQGSFTNTAISVGYGLISMAAAALSPVLPPLLGLLAAAYLLGAFAFWRAPSKLPGLPSTMTRPKS
ncbi:MAG TPA: hypothetical protein DCM05_18035 [Elusimicrobia bacterium]|nr:hypothetical protein [Elusimicrobiota bacterium]